MAIIKIMSGGAPKEVFAELTPAFEARNLPPSSPAPAGDPVIPA